MSLSNSPSPGASSPPVTPDTLSLQAAARIAALALDQDDPTLRPLAAAALRNALSAGRSKVSPLVPPLVSRVVYRSHSLMSEEGHHELLSQCQRNNVALNISGVLIHAHAEFMQVLEGPIGHLSALAEKIYKDPRHRDFVLIKTEIDVPRLFGSWSMASMEIDPDYFRMLSEHLSRQDGDVTRTLREFVSQRPQNACVWAA